MASLELQNISKAYGATSVIHGVDLVIKEGEFVVLVGPSGCGKSTLLRCIAGLEATSSGRMMQDGIDITRASAVERGVAMVFQSYALYPHMTVAENIGFGLRIAGEKKPVIQARVIEIAKLLKLEALLARKPRALSGGQRQRVAIGRALARRPKIFLFDEPLSNLDAALRAEMRVELAKLHSRLGNTMIYVTHDQVEGMTLANRIVVMNAGRIEQCGTPLEVFNRPVNKFVAGFLGQPPINIVRTTDAHREGASVLATLPGGRRTTAVVDPDNKASVDGLELGIRPENLSIGEPGQGLQVQVDLVEQLGNETILYGRLVDGQAMTARLPGQAGLKAGENVWLRVADDKTIAFGADGLSLGSALAMA